jgi:hypothetical protein
MLNILALGRKILEVRWKCSIFKTAAYGGISAGPIMAVREMVDALVVAADAPMVVIVQAKEE